MSLLAYDRAQVEADAERIRIAEEENRIFKDLKFHTPASRAQYITCLLYTSPSPRDRTRSRMPSSA